MKITEQPIRRHTRATYTKYRTSRFGARPLRLPVSVDGAAVGAFGWKRSRGEGRRRFSGASLLKKITTLLMIAGIGMVAYAGSTFGYGYLQARSGQDGLRALFHISGSGSVDPNYLRSEANALAARLNHLDPVGEISIPRIGVQWMIVQGADKEALKKGPGHLEETPLPGAGGNFAVAGDRVLYGAPFLNLDEINPGDEIRVKMAYATFVYRVRERFIVTPDDVSVLQPVGYEAITLLTCDPPWDIKQRIVVRGEIADVLPAGS
jgi:sortase A